MLPALGKHKNVPTAKQIQFPHCPLNISLWQSSIKHWQTCSVNHTLSKARLIFSFNSPQRNLHVSVSSFSFSSKMSIGEEENLLIMFQIALWDKWRSLEASARQKVWTDGGLGGDMWTQFKVFYLDCVQGMARNHTGNSWGWKQSIIQNTEAFVAGQDAMGLEERGDFHRNSCKGQSNDQHDALSLTTAKSWA